jgi:hypothetical protein
MVKVTPERTGTTRRTPTNSATQKLTSTTLLSTRSLSAANRNTTYFEQVGLTLVQTQGMLDGYTSMAPPEQMLSKQDWLMYQLQFEIGDIAAAVKAAAGTARKTPETYADSFNQHCSVLVKPVYEKDGETFRSLLAAHTTWASFSDMLRLYRHVNLAYRTVPGVSYSSFPGILVSGDDYYTTSAKLQVMETTNSVYDQTIYAATTVTTFPFWVRVMVATHTATSGAEWMTLFGKLNSGTYNNQVRRDKHALLLFRSHS